MTEEIQIILEPTQTKAETIQILAQLRAKGTIQITQALNQAKETIQIIQVQTPTKLGINQIQAPIQIKAETIQNLEQLQTKVGISQIQNQNQKNQEKLGTQEIQIKNQTIVRINQILDIIQVRIQKVQGLVQSQMMEKIKQNQLAKTLVKKLKGTKKIL